MAYLFSSFLVAAGQVLAILLFFLWKEREPFVRGPQRTALTAVFFLIHWILQMVLYRYLD